MFWRRLHKKGGGQLYEHLVRFYPAGTYQWISPINGFVDAFCVGGGGSGSGQNGGGGGYTSTFLNIPVYIGQIINIVVGAGGTGTSVPTMNGGYSEFMNLLYRASGGFSGADSSSGRNGGSGGGTSRNSSSDTGGIGGSDGGNGFYGSSPNTTYNVGVGQGSTTRDFGEPTGKINAGGGGGYGGGPAGGYSDYTEGSGSRGGTTSQYGYGGGGYGGGGGGGATVGQGPSGGDGTVLVRFYMPYPQV